MNKIIKYKDKYMIIDNDLYVDNIDKFNSYGDFVKFCFEIRDNTFIDDLKNLEL